MAEDKRLIELVKDLLFEVREMKGDIREIRSELCVFRKETDAHFNQVDHRLERLEGQQMKTNMVNGELRLSVMKISEELKALVDLDKQLRVVEGIVLKAS